MNNITFLSDFGVIHSYTGAVKGVILSINPEAKIVDISHSVDSYQIEEAAYLLDTYYWSFPPKTVHLAVVDPGVGGPRSPAIFETVKYFFVGPDNGLFSRIFVREACRYYQISVEKLYAAQDIITSVSPTFHARDIFAPVSALLSKGVPPHKLADISNENPVMFGEHLKISGDKAQIRILTVDGFGNIITSFTREDLKKLKKEKVIALKIRGRIISDFKETYSESEKGKLMLLWGSSGHLEVAINQGNAADFLKCSNREEENIEIILK